MPPLTDQLGRPALDHGILTGVRRSVATPDFLIVQADPTDVRRHRALRTEVFVREQGIFDRDDRDDVDDDPRTIVLVALDERGDLLGGVRLHPARDPALTGETDLGWWQGSRLAVVPGARHGAGVGAALVRAACARAEAEGALRFEATVQARHEPLFTGLGWSRRRATTLHGHPHVVLEWPIARAQRLARATKSALGDLLAGMSPGGRDFVGDDGAPVPGSDLVAACDAILPSMVERDPEWAGWCAALVNLNDLSAMGARHVGMLDAVAARDASFARRVLAGLREASAAWEVPVLGGHTQLGVPAALSVTALGRAERLVRGGGGSAGETLRLTADLSGGWRPGYSGQQWDSSSGRTGAELRALGGVVPALEPTAGKDVSMGGLIGTTGMLAEASGVRAVIDVADVPRPTAASVGDWFTCFPGFAMVTAERAASGAALPPTVTSRTCGELTSGHGVGLRWPDGVVTEAVTDHVTGMGTA